jgi:hypothetical protein
MFVVYPEQHHCLVEQALVAGSLGDMRPDERDGEECNERHEILINSTATQVFFVSAVFRAGSSSNFKIFSLLTISGRRVHGYTHDWKKTERPSTNLVYSGNQVGNYTIALHLHMIHYSS